MSDLLTRLDKHLSRNNPTFEDLSDVDKAIAVQLVQANKDFILKDLPNLIYDQIPPTIEEFLTPEVMGLSAESTFPVWRRELTQSIFGPHSKLKELIFAGATGTGKTITAQKCFWYNMTRILCFKCPQLMFGVDPAQILATIFISVDLSKAWMALLLPFIQMLRGAPKYVEVKKELEFNDFDMTDKIPFFIDRGAGIIHLPKNLIVYSGSQESHSISMSLIQAMLDEAEFRRAADSVAEAMSLYETLSERIDNRFLDIPWTLRCLVSSAKSSEGIIPTYINSIGDSNTKTKVYTYSVWEVREFDVYKKGYFYVLKGNKLVPSRILSDQEYTKHEAGKFELPRNCKIIKVPDAHKPMFEQNVNRALRNVAGEVSIEEIYIFDDYGCFENYDTALCPELYMRAELRADTVHLINQLPPEYITGYSETQRFFKRAPQAARYAHVDLAEVTEAGICVCHKELGPGNAILYVIDFVVKLTSPTRIDIMAVIQFFLDLREEFSCNFEVISADQYQSATMLQQLTVHKVATNVRRLSVDKTLEAYHRAAGLVNGCMVRIGHAPTLHEQAKAIKEKEGKLQTRVRKDMLDAFVGATFNAMCDVKTEPVYTYSHEGGASIVRPAPKNVVREEIG